jgi:hypothetical protein
MPAPDPTTDLERRLRDAAPELIELARDVHALLDHEAAATAGTDPEELDPERRSSGFYDVYDLADLISTAFAVDGPDEVRWKRLSTAERTLSELRGGS